MMNNEFVTQQAARWADSAISKESDPDRRLTADV